VRRHVLDAIESGVCRGTGVALAMAKVLVEVDLTRVDGFPVGEELHRHEGLVRPSKGGGGRPCSCCRGAGEAPPSLGFFLYILLCPLHIGALCIGPLMN
jgi:hypothetical protein